MFLRESRELQDPMRKLLFAFGLSAVLLSLGFYAGRYSVKRDMRFVPEVMSLGDNISLHSLRNVLGIESRHAQMPMVSSSVHEYEWRKCGIIFRASISHGRADDGTCYALSIKFGEDTNLLAREIPGAWETRRETVMAD
jgi:hypothetical protein